MAYSLYQDGLSGQHYMRCTAVGRVGAQTSSWRACACGHKLATGCRLQARPRRARSGPACVQRSCTQSTAPTRLPRPAHHLRARWRHSPQPAAKGQYVPYRSSSASSDSTYATVDLLSPDAREWYSDVLAANLLGNETANAYGFTGAGGVGASRRGGVRWRGHCVCETLCAHCQSVALLASALRSRTPLRRRFTNPPPGLMADMADQLPFSPYAVLSGGVTPGVARASFPELWCDAHVRLGLSVETICCAKRRH